MIPLFATLRIGGRRRWIPVPLFLVWLLLLPLCLVLLPVFLVGCRVLKIPGLRALAALFGLLRALRGTSLQVQHESVNLALRLI